MNRAVQSSNKSSIHTANSAILEIAPAIPSDMVAYIVNIGLRFRELSALSVSSKSWNVACNEVMDEIRDVACSATEPVLIVKEKCQTFALAFAVSRLSQRSHLQEMNADTHASLSNSQAQLWKLNRVQPPLPEVAQVLFNMKGLDKDSWKLLLEVTVRKAALNLLALDPDTEAVFRQDHREEICASATRSVDDYLEQEHIHGGALRDYAQAIDRLGKNTSVPYSSPFHRILFASLIHRPQAFHALIQLANHLNRVDFFEFSTRVEERFTHNENVLFSLSMTTANWVARAGKQVLSETDATALISAMKRIQRRCLEMTGLSPVLRREVQSEHQELLLKLPEIVSKLISVIPLDNKKQKQRKGLLKPLMKFLRSSFDTSEERQAACKAVMARAHKENWLPNNPDLKFRHFRL